MRTNDRHGVALHHNVAISQQFNRLSEMVRDAVSGEWCASVVWLEGIGIVACVRRCKDDDKRHTLTLSVAALGPTRRCRRFTNRSCGVGGVLIRYSK